MALARNHNRIWAWFLATALLGTAAGGLFVGFSPARAACASAAHSCCCAAGGLTKCGCSGHAGLPAQLASLTTCSDATELPLFVVAPLPALLPGTDIASVTLEPLGAAVPSEPRRHLLDVPSPSPPPPQASA